MWLIWTLRLCALLTGAVVVLIVVFLGIESYAAFDHVGVARFLSDDGWHPDAGPEAGRFNLTPMIAGTLSATAGAVLFAAPLGVGSAVFAHFYAPRPLRRAVGKLLEIQAGIPSVVYGFWGLVVLVPLIADWRPPGASLLAAIVILTIMITPTIALVSGAAFENLPREHLQAAAALGLSRRRTVTGVVLPAARAGVFTAILLGTGRAIGETMAVLMVSGNVVQTPGSIFEPVRTLAANIALETAYALGDHRSALFVSGLVLTAMVAILVSLAALVERRFAPYGKHERSTTKG